MIIKVPVYLETDLKLSPDEVQKFQFFLEAEIPRLVGKGSNEVLLKTSMIKSAAGPRGSYAFLPSEVKMKLLSFSTVKKRMLSPK